MRPKKTVGANEGSAVLSVKGSMRKRGGEEKREQSDFKWGLSGRGEWKRWSSGEPASIAVE